MVELVYNNTQATLSSNVKKSIITFDLMNLTTNMIEQKWVLPEGFDNKYPLPIKGIKRGVYALIIRKDNFSTTQKLFIN